MIAELLPDGVASAVADRDDPEQQALPEEAAQIGRAIASRRLEFTTGRLCARRALRTLGLPASAILCGPAREPIWPRGVVGSITHCPGYRAAAAALTDDIMTLGIDAEVHASLPPRVLQRISLPEERQWIDGAPPGLHWDRLLFSAKESVYKAWFPLTRVHLGFQDAHVRFEPAAGRFHASVRRARDPARAGARAEFTGRFLVRNGLVLTAIAVAQRTPRVATGTTTINRLPRSV